MLAAGEAVLLGHLQHRVRPRAQHRVPGEYSTVQYSTVQYRVLGESCLLSCR